MKIAVVGAGVSGLVAAHLLAPEHEVTVFEANAYAGGHTNTVRVDTPHETHWVDTGFIVFNDRNYPRFERLLDRIGVHGQPSNMSFAVTDEAGDFEYASTSPNGLFAKRAHLATPWFHRMVADLLRFQREARALLASDGDGPSLGHFLDGAPLLARVRGSADRPAGRGRVVRRPAPDVELPGALPDRVLREPRDARLRATARSGARSSAARIATSRRWWRRGATASASPPRSSRSAGTPTTSRSRRAAATPSASTTSSWPRTPTRRSRCWPTRAEREHELLGAIPYQPNEAVLHTDERMLPRRRRAWASWNYHLLEEPTGKPTVTYHMNRLQTLAAEREFCVTLNRTRGDRPGQGHPHDPVRASRLHRRRPRRPGAPRGDQRPEPHALLRRLLGLGLP